MTTKRYILSRPLSFCWILTNVLSNKWLQRQIHWCMFIRYFIFNLCPGKDFEVEKMCCQDYTFEYILNIFIREKQINCVYTMTSMTSSRKIFTTFLTSVIRIIICEWICEWLEIGEWLRWGISFKLCSMLSRLPLC